MLIGFWSGCSCDPRLGAPNDPGLRMTQGATGVRWYLTLYVSGASPRSAAAIDTIRQICDIDLAGRVDLRIIDVGEQPALAVSDRIMAVPTLVKRLPAPARQLVGNLADHNRVRAGIDLVPVSGSPEVSPHSNSHLA